MFVLYSTYEIFCLRLPNICSSSYVSRGKEAKGSNTHNNNILFASPVCIQFFSIEWISLEMSYLDGANNDEPILYATLNIWTSRVENFLPQKQSTNNN
jgi:hypothetical protein